MTRKKVFLGCAGIVVSCTLFFLVAVFLRVRRDQAAFFAPYDNAAEVQAVILSEFKVGETSLAEVENTLNANRFSNLFCYPARPLMGTLNPEDSNIVKHCEAPTGKPDVSPGHYKIIFTFDDENLTEVLVTLEYK